ncbi:venom carboxylesterase-6-like [Diabrotica virgifera virgifera]|uniref:Carboxylic ester hydrolase n=1 Tax=Diabrotica virgifera virgifera TaxID=50390 RepID=A0ABM5JI28_DIAVI|nr:venom carboxylesterase-6-like [Diabrotica virgifera virgifera]
MIMIVITITKFQILYKRISRKTNLSKTRIMISRLIIFCSLIFVANKEVVSSPVTEAQSEDDDLIVELENLGKIRGHILQSSEGSNFYAFQDIPYGESTAGSNRFKPSKPRGPWDGVLNATENKKTCPQISMRLNYLNSGSDQSEDCLVLNVYTPVKPSSDKSLPVYFWIHGGGFVLGSGSISTFDPKYLIDYDIVIVTINYRLGVLGFLTTLDDSIPGNLGLKDQLLALKWTHDHIHKFGGDPNQVTVGGASAGSMSTGFQLLSRASKGLFRGIIQQSGSPLSRYFYPWDDREHAFEFGKALNSSFTSTESSDLLELLQQASYTDILDVQKKFSAGISIVGFTDSLIYKPVLEDESNDDAFVTEPMHGAVLNGHFNLVPILLGINSEEALYFFGHTKNATLEERAKFFDESPANLVAESLNIVEEDRETVGNGFKEIYNTSSFVEDTNAFVKYTSNEVFTRAVIRQAEGASQYVPVYLYQLSWLPENSTDIGVPHGSEGWYFWGGTPSGPITESLRKPLLKLWTNFINTRIPLQRRITKRKT